MIEYCVCEHKKADHRNKRFDDATQHIYTTLVCWSFPGICPCMEFKLDNLKLIEDLAKEKGLV
jgi:hypothetical protein